MPTAKPNRRGRHTVCWSAAAWCLAAGLLVHGIAAPADAEHVDVRDVASGSAEFVRDGNELRIRTDDGTVINYDRFDVPLDHLVEFQQPHEAARVLNRIHSETPSHIEGALHANGIVYFANPAGMIFGPEAVVDAAQFHAVAGNITDDDFLNHRDRFFTDNGELIHKGQILARGDVSLIGAKVASHGLIRAPQGVVTLAAGDEVFLRQEGSTLLLQVDGLDAATGQSKQADPSSDARPDEAGVRHTGAVEGDDVYFAVGDVYSMALENEGTIEARGGDVTMAGDGDVRHDGKVNVSRTAPHEHGGTVQITGEHIDIAGTIDARGGAGGGEVRIGGDKQGQGALRRAAITALSNAAHIDADATGRGDGGRVIVWADDRADYAGRISARGGAQGGDGGFVEVSGKRWLSFRGLVDLTAPQGAAGRLLLDPTDITIASTGEESDTDTAFDDDHTFQADGEVPASLLSTQTLEQQLALGHVTVTTESEADGDGDISVEDSFGWESDFDLTLLADRHITLGNDVQIAQGGGGSITLRADRTGVGEDALDGTVGFGSGAALNWAASNGDVTVLYNVADYALPEQFDDIGHVNMGEGTYRELMLVNTPERLQAIGDNLAGNYALGRDLDATATADWSEGAGFEPVGDEETPFVGTLDGRGHVIHGLHIDRPETPHVGLFGRLEEVAQIERLGLKDVTVTGLGGELGVAGGVGALAGVAAGESVLRDTFATGAVAGSERGVGGLVGITESGATVRDSHTTTTIHGNGDFIGGLIGLMRGSSEASDVHALGNVTGTRNVGGLVGGLAGSAELHRAFATGNVTGGTRHIGGLVGNMTAWAEVSHAHASGNVGGNGFAVGGLIGRLTADSSVANAYATGNVVGDFTAAGSFVGKMTSTSTVQNAYGSGAVDAQDDVGGFAGRLIEDASITASFFDRDTTGHADAVAEVETEGTIDVTALSLTEPDFARPDDRAVYQAADWDFEQSWFIFDGGTRPFLRSEHAERIVSAHQLQLMWLDLEGEYRLGRDLALSDALTDEARPWLGFGFIPLGNAESPFTGSFDGGGHSINDLLVEGGPDVGFFATTHDATIRDVALRDAQVTGIARVGGLIGRQVGGSVRGTSVTGTVTGNRQVGGLVGAGGFETSEAPGGNITDSHSDAVVVGDTMVGGLVGRQRGGEITDSSAAGAVTGEQRVGGLAGMIHAGTQLTGSAATGEVTGDTRVGGLVGWLLNPPTRIADSHAASDVEGTFGVGGLVGVQANGAVVAHSHFTGSVTTSEFGEDVGGLVGLLDGIIEDSYALAAVRGQDHVGGLIGRIPDGSPATVQRAHAGGPVSGELAVGGFIGRYDGGTINASFYNTETTGAPPASGAGEGPTGDIVGLETAELMQPQTFTEADWDLDETWTLIEGLSFPFHPHQFNDPRVVSGTLAEVAGAADAPRITLAPDGPALFATHAGADGFYHMLIDEADAPLLDAFILVQAEDRHAHALLRGDDGQVTGIDLAPDSLTLHQVDDRTLGNAFLVDAHAALDGAERPWNTSDLDVALDAGIALRVADAPFALGGDVTTTAALEFSAVDLEADATLEAGDTIGAQVIDGPHALTLIAEEGTSVAGGIGDRITDLTVEAGALDVGNIEVLGELTAGGDVTSADTIDARAITAGGSVTAEQGDVLVTDALAAASVEASGHIIADTATITGTTTAGASVTIAGAGEFGGEVVAEEAIGVGGPTSFAVGATSHEGNIALGGPVTLTGDVDFTAATNASFLDAIDSDGETSRALAVTVENGTASLLGPVGGAQPLERVTVEAPFIDVTDVTTTFEQTYTAALRFELRGALALDGATLEARVRQGALADEGDNGYEELGLFVRENASIDSGGGEVRLINEAGTGIVIDGAITTEPGDGGTLTLENATVNVAPTPGAGDIEIRNITDDLPDDPDDPLDLVINDDIIEAVTIQLTALRDIIVNALLQTTADDADIVLTADSSGDGDGGVHVTGAGRLDAGRDAIVHGSSLATAGAGEAVLIDAHEDAPRISAAGHIGISGHESAGPIVTHGDLDAHGNDAGITLQSPGGVELDGATLTTAGGDLHVRSSAEGVTDAIIIGRDSALDAGEGAIELTSDSLIADAAARIAGVGALVIQPRDPQRPIHVASGEGGLEVSDDLLAALEPGFASIIIGRADGAHSIDIHGATFHDPMVFRAPVEPGEINILGDLLFANDASVLFLGPGDTTNLAADIATEGNPITFADAVIVDGNRRIDTTAGDTVVAGAPVTFGSRTDAATPRVDSLSIDAGTTGSATFVGGVGQSAPLGRLDVTRAARVSVNQPVTVNGDVTINVSEAFTQASEAPIRSGGNFTVAGGGTASLGAGVRSGGRVRLGAVSVPTDVVISVAGAVGREQPAAAAGEPDDDAAAVAHSAAVLGLDRDAAIDPLFAQLFSSQWRGFEQRRAERFRYLVHVQLVERELDPRAAVAALREGDALYEDLAELASLLDLIEAMGLDEARQHDARRALLGRLRPQTVELDDLDALVTAMRRAMRVAGG